MIYLKNSFLGYNYPIEEAEVCFIGIPFDSTALNPGSKFGPAGIREALKVIEGYDSKLGIDIFGELKICDLGDVEIVPGSYELTAERIKDTIDSLREINREIFFVFLGGEHLITLPVVESLNPGTVIDFDAHADLRKDMLRAKFSHATWASHIINKVNLIQRGVRSFSLEEEESMKNLGKKISGSTYLTVDIDVFDPGIAPDTGLPEPDGWTFSDFCENLDEVIKSTEIKNLIGMDVVEVAPREFNSVTSTLAANVVKKVLGAVVSEK